MATKTFDLSSTYTITPTQVEQYHKDGHIVLRGVVTREEIDHIRLLIMELVEEIAHTRDTRVRLEDKSTLFAEVTNVWQKSEQIREFIFAERFARIAAELMRVKGVRLYHDQALFKEPGGSPTPWHKDHYYWPLATQHTIKMWLALSDISPDMGAMIFASGSHRGGLFPEVPFTLNTQEIFNRVIKKRQIPTPSHFLNAGDATFHSGNVLHSTSENTSTRRREVIAIIYYADGTRIMVPDHEHRRVDMKEYLPGLAPGDVAASELNPLLYESAP